MDPWNILGWLLVGLLALIVIAVLIVIIFLSISVSLYLRDRKIETAKQERLLAEKGLLVPALDADPLGKPIMIDDRVFIIKEVEVEHVIEYNQDRVRLTLHERA